MKNNIFCQEINIKSTTNIIDVENELNDVHVFEIEYDADWMSTCENENISNEEIHVTCEGEMTQC